jgi:hypothetical protein
MNLRLALISGVILAAISPLASAHGLDGHHAPFMALLRHLFFEHGYLLVLPIGLGMVWYLRRDRTKQDSRSGRRN